jgi:hypothetical protein
LQAVKAGVIKEQKRYYRPKEQGYTPAVGYIVLNDIFLQSLINQGELIPSAWVNRSCIFNRPFECVVECYFSPRCSLSPKITLRNISGSLINKSGFKLYQYSKAFDIAFNEGTEGRFCKQYDIFKNTPSPL